MESNTARRLALVIDADVTRLTAMKRVVEAAALDTAVFLVDVPEGRAAISLLKDVLAQPGLRLHAVVLVRARPDSWASAAMLAAVRSQRDYDQVDVVVAAEGTRDMLPVLITDFPALRVVSPNSHPCEVVASIVEARFSALDPVPDR